MRGVQFKRFRRHPHMLPVMTRAVCFVLFSIPRG